MSSANPDNKDEDEDTRSMVRRLLSSHDQLNKDVRTVIAQHSEHATKIDNLNTEVRTISVQLDRARREKNIILFNLPDTEATSRNLVATIYDTFARVNLVLPEWSIDDAFRVKGSGTKRPVIVKFLTTSWVRKVFSAAADLRKIGLRIDNDLSPEDRASKKAVLAARRELKNAGIVAVIKNNSLLLDGRRIDPADVASILARAKLPASVSTSSGTSFPGSYRDVSSRSSQAPRNSESRSGGQAIGPPPPVDTLMTSHTGAGSEFSPSSLSATSTFTSLPAAASPLSLSHTGAPAVDPRLLPSAANDRSEAKRACSPTTESQQRKKAAHNRLADKTASHSPLRQAKLNFSLSTAMSPRTERNDQLSPTPMSVVNPDE